MAGQSRFYFPQLDGLRFMAFSLVFVHHYARSGNALIDRIADFGWTGVDLFLVLSSFLIFSLLLSEHASTGTISLKAFFIRRVLRIWPLYYPYLIVSFVTLAVARAPGWPIILKANFLTFLLFVGNFSYPFFPGNDSFSHLWAISLEEQFYLFVPFIVLYWSRPLQIHTLAITLFCIAFAAVWRVYFVANSHYPAVWAMSPARIDPFAVGAALAVLVRSKPEILSAPLGWTMLGLAIAGFYLVSSFPDFGHNYHAVWQLAVVALMGGALCLAALAKGGPGKVLTLGPLPFLGKISYGLYVFHELALFMTRKLWPALSWPSGLILALVISIAMATASYFLLERRFLLLKYKFERIHSRPA